MWRVRLIGLANRQRPAFSPRSKTGGNGMPQTNQSPGQSLSSNKRAEAEAFDRVAGRVDRNTLRTSEGTFLRYRSATVGTRYIQNILTRCFPSWGDFSTVRGNRRTSHFKGFGYWILGPGTEVGRLFWLIRAQRWFQWKFLRNKWAPWARRSEERRVGKECV